MPVHAEKRVLPYSPEQLFDLVADIEKYPEYLPWCGGARVRKREGNVLYADMVIGFKMIRERFTSKVTCRRPGERAAGEGGAKAREVGTEAGRIDVVYLDGPLRRLRNHWVFEPAEGGGCAIDFYVDFDFHSRILEKLIGAFFNEAVRRMVSAFEARAKIIYGPPQGEVSRASRLRLRARAKAAVSRAAK